MRPYKDKDSDYGHRMAEVAREASGWIFLMGTCIAFLLILSILIGVFLIAVIVTIFIIGLSMVLICTIELSNLKTRSMMMSLLKKKRGSRA